MTEMIVCPYCQVKVIRDPKPGMKCECGGELPKQKIKKLTLK